MDSFITIRFKRAIAKRFQQFSKSHFKTHTQTMEAMLDFFHDNELSPKDKFGPSGRTLEQHLKKRMNAIIAIIRDMEKHKINPTLAMLEALFQQEDVPQKPKFIEKKQSPKESEFRFQERRNKNH
ncbi:BfmA/BtgA family mobilization protein [Zunongwangia profunda]|jgi:hypothetical protein|uniref:BfmA/BtgA family mobilization protein n=1 Tax=Zunongwangia profunda TaxID=398743 RepID=UPI001D184F04|nr:BfmA/BtgA family mobilization protein [Zunongwangia profunda]MCC4230066.1 hypothetical protein [Zunongwangia profunda]|tara:strand:+ start:11130 stop:11504 length:375 start_codon:yes stop_codon:yes gene_type:complete